MSSVQVAPGLLVGDARPQVGLDLAVDVQRERCAEFAVIGEVPLEGVGDCAEPIRHLPWISMLLIAENVASPPPMSFSADRVR